MTELFQAANAHPRMGKIYDQYFQAWTDAGGDLFCYFSSVGRWSKWGSWGILQFYDDDPAKSPKFMSTMSNPDSTSFMAPAANCSGSAPINWPPTGCSSSLV